MLGFSFYLLPSNLVLLTFCGFGAALALLMPLLRQAIIRACRSRFGIMNGTKFVAPPAVFTALAATLGVLLSVFLVQQQKNFLAITTQISLEANDINNLDRLLARFPDAELMSFRVNLAQYAESIVSQEWRVNVDGTKPESSNPHLNKVSRGVFSFAPKNQQGSQFHNLVMSQLMKLFEHRVKRLHLSSHYKLSIVFWNAIFFLTSLLAVLAFLENNSLERILGLSGQAMGLGLLIGLVFLYDHPFVGDSAVSNEPFLETLRLISQRT